MPDPLPPSGWHEAEERRNTAEDARKAAEHQRSVAEEGRRSAEGLRERIAGDWEFLQCVLRAADEARATQIEIRRALRQMQSLVDEFRALMQAARTDAADERVAADEQRRILAEQYKALEGDPRS